MYDIRTYIYIYIIYVFIHTCICISGLAGHGSEGTWQDSGFDDELLDLALIGRTVACEWLHNNTEKWRNWLPALCKPGSLPNGAMTTCVACAAGYFCPSYTQNDILCPVGYFCPVNSSEPQQCDRGRTSERGSSSESDCKCSSASVWISNWCRPVLDFLLPVIILPICVMLILLFVLHLFLKRLREKQKWIIRVDELAFEDDDRSSRGAPSELGSGPAGRSIVYVASFRDRKVAVKIMATPIGKEGHAPLLPPGVNPDLDSMHQGSSAQVAALNLERGDRGSV
jgi:hypothetical protein